MLRLGIRGQGQQLLVCFKQDSIYETMNKLVHDTFSLSLTWRNTNSVVCNSNTCISVPK